jgi:septum formation protein
MSDNKIVLASASPRREELLALICPTFEIIPSEFDESTMPEDLSPAQHVLVSAREKARDVAARAKNAIIIGADTIVVVDDTILGKPADEENACKMLKTLSGRTHQVYTGICVIGSDGREMQDYESTDVNFRELSDDIIHRYVATGEPLDKAGAYAIQGRGSVLITGICGDYFNVVGLPVYKLGLLLEKLGVEVLSCR